MFFPKITSLLCAFPSSPTRQMCRFTIADGQSVELQTVLTSGNGNCLTTPTNADGRWSSRPAEAIPLTRGSSRAVTTLQIFGDKCLDVTNDLIWYQPTQPLTPRRFVISLKKDLSHCIAASASTAGAPVVVELCAAQTWSDPTNDGHITIFSNLCITPAATAITGDTKLVLAACDPSNTN
ncbi:hypothetical protein C8R44DRAFT_868553 [Mycena epipterygia]|nr:hypothetical protein C8R44DRAFT_868553 [Mycena epipterygia]